MIQVTRRVLDGFCHCIFCFLQTVLFLVRAVLLQIFANLCANELLKTSRPLRGNMHWTVHIEGGPRRVNHAAVCIENKIYSFGGYCSTEEYRDWAPIPIHVLDTTTLRWAPVNYKHNTVVPFQRYGHTTVAYGHKVGSKAAFTYV